MRLPGTLTWWVVSSAASLTCTWNLRVPMGVTVISAMVCIILRSTLGGEQLAAVHRVLPRWRPGSCCASLTADQGLRVVARLCINVRTRPLLLGRKRPDAARMSTQEETRLRQRVYPQPTTT